MPQRSRSGFVDLHCHWVAGIDDGARSVEEGLEMLRALYEAGFDHVVATPHMRPGMFDNAPEDLRAAYRAMKAQVKGPADSLPRLSLGSEHFFAPEVVGSLLAGRALPYRGDDQAGEQANRSGGAVLLEFSDLSPLPVIEKQLFRLCTSGFLPVIAHPERYAAVWKTPDLVERLQAAGCVALLDVCAIVGKYGRRPRATARKLLEEGVYHAACSDSHRPSDVQLTVEAMDDVAEEYGEEELELLFKAGPLDLLAGRRPQTM